MTEADENLRKIDHIVVLMMENRSFGAKADLLAARRQLDAAGKAVF